MGYVSESLQEYIGYEKCSFTAGTWADTVASNVWYARRTAADAAFTIRIPIELPYKGKDVGCKLTSLDIHYVISTAAVDSAAAALYAATIPADGAAFSAAAVTTTYDTGHDTAAERLDADEHKMTLTPSADLWMDDDYIYYAELVVDAAATSVFDFIGAVAHFVLRA